MLGLGSAVGLGSGVGLGLVHLAMVGDRLEQLELDFHRLLELLVRVRSRGRGRGRGRGLDLRVCPNLALVREG